MPRTLVKTNDQKNSPPRFPSEAAEAVWWGSRRKDIEASLMYSLQHDTARVGTAQELTRQARASKNITIRVAVAEVDRARKLS